MLFEEQKIKGCYLIRKDIPRDERGYFSRLADVKEFAFNGLNGNFVQISASGNYKKGTLRGLHMQVEPSQEEKLVCCVSGEVFDVCVDLRKGSDTYLKYCFATLSEDNGNAFYIPRGCAHGFISLKDESRLIYFMTAAHDPDAERGFRWSDPAFSIEWPITPKIISDKDNAWPLTGENING